MTAPDDQIAAVILAGGFGTRIRHLLPEIPKPMALVLGWPFLEWVIRYLASQGIRRVVISSGYRAEVIEAYFSKQPVNEVSVLCVPEPEPLGTAGGFINGLERSGQRASAWMVLNGDSLALAPLKPVTDAVLNQGSSAAILGLRMLDTSRYGTIAQNENGELIRFEEKKPGTGIINAGVYLFGSNVLGMFPKRAPLSFEREVFPTLIDQHAKIRVCTVDAPFLDIGTPESLPQAEAFITSNQSWFA